VEIWEATNRQDWDIIERAQSGIASVRYQPGPYSARESLPAAWDRAYLELMAGGEMGRRGDGEAESGTDGGR
jgi:Rieske 2Fe-2S family protein